GRYSRRMVPRASFGSTGHESRRTLFGAAALGRVSEAEADRALELVLRYDLDHIDTAASYGDSELLIARWLAREGRDRFFLATQLRNPAYAADAETLIALCGDRGVAMQTIKSITLGPWPGQRPPRPTTWYEPLTDQGDIDVAVRFVLARQGLFLNTPSDIELL